MKTPHHATAKKALANGIELKEMTDGKCGAYSTGTGKLLASAVDPRDALDLALAETKPVKLKPRKSAKKAKPRAQDEDGDGDENDGEDGGEPEEGADKSVVKKKYKGRYKPHRMTNGDDVARAVREHFMTKKDPDNGKPRLDWPKFRAFAQHNDCWQPSYAHLNHGLARMSVVNRLRAKVADGHEIKWGA